MALDNHEIDTAVMGGGGLAGLAAVDTTTLVRAGLLNPAEQWEARSTACLRAGPGNNPTGRTAYNKRRTTCKGNTPFTIRDCPSEKRVPPSFRP